ncbi:transporter substrate-binding domain-containing protein [Fulvivirgaceae bacterium PWU4]|uniref:Transporter substrate-binding domain-containing protein n=1 Tax=Chryseosolibacter histidini TaxID=2782349 RepID=A0AAP2DPB7_9BACT|nr:transporter substrate-binding domain-containing protein [Chryseosolibacter histidini]MBT1700001.1 transporter substrate-binding domain-containing protein [Chryseosolibacter histidini]
MKKFFIPILTLIVSFSFAQKYQGDSWNKIKTSGSGTLAVVYYEQPGLIQKGKDGKMEGVCVDMLSDLQKFAETKHGKKITIQYVGQEPEFSGFLKEIQHSGNVLGVTNTSITEERKKILQFSPPFMSTQLVLLTNKNTPNIKSLKELSTVYSGFTAQVITGSTHVKYIEEIKKQYYPQLTVTYAPSSESVIKNLSANQRVFSILDFTEYIGVVRKKIPVKRQEVELGNPEQLGFIMSKQSDWGPLFKEFLTEDYRKSVRYKEIIAENLGSSFLSLVR